MRNKKNIIYWISTLWLALGMFSTGLVQLIKEQVTVDFMTQAGYPMYFLTMLGIGKMLGVVVLLLPKLAIAKEWAYAGFTFIVLGAAFTYISLGIYDDLYHLILLMVLIVVSWYTRPQSRKVLVNKN